MKLLLSAVVTGLGCLALSCGEPAETTDTGDVFVAFSEDFRGFHSWQSFDVSKDAGSGAASVDSDAGIDQIHSGAKVIEYIEALPGAGSDAFPVGTLIVKEATSPESEPRVFAMAKRGGSYNKNAPGWEWFELEGVDDGRDGVKIIWRGVGPPKGEKYGGDPNGGCNSCHGACNSNDSVCSTPLTLSSF